MRTDKCGSPDDGWLATETNCIYSKSFVADV
jgi:hypothetical protein